MKLPPSPALAGCHQGERENCDFRHWFMERERPQTTDEGKRESHKRAQKSTKRGPKALVDCCHKQGVHERGGGVCDLAGLGAGAGAEFIQAFERLRVYFDES